MSRPSADEIFSQLMFGASSGSPTPEKKKPLKKKRKLQDATIGKDSKKPRTAEPTPVARPLVPKQLESRSATITATAPAPAVSQQLELGSPVKRPTATETAVSSSIASVSSSSSSSSSSTSNAKSSRETLAEFIRELMPAEALGKDGLPAKLRSKVLLLENSRDELTLEQREERRHKRAAKTKKTMSARERKEKGVFNIPKGSLTYTMLLPLHHLWNQYMLDLLGGSNSSLADNRLLKADFHGALMEVTRCSCPTLVGIQGIMFKETQKTFNIMTVDNKIKVVPKQSTVFSLPIGATLVHIFGNQFMFRASERSVKKFKPKPSIAV